VHHGAVAVVDRDGRSSFRRGDPEVVTYTRSSLKPLQALPFVAAGGLERYKLTTQETALLCASHSGEARHVEAAASILAKAGNDASDLQCGTHPPVHYDVAARSRLRRRTRRCRTTARASTAACSRIAPPAATASATTSRWSIRCSGRSAPRSPR
jgi:L-asparaginase II